MLNWRSNQFKLSCPDAWSINEGNIPKYFDQKRRSFGSRVFWNISTIHRHSWVLRDGIGTMMLNGQVSFTISRRFEQTHSPWPVHSTTMRSLTDGCQVRFNCDNLIAHYRFPNFTLFPFSLILNKIFLWTNALFRECP